jgi:murein DD-endopeptidase MepM/ murein hydrolase activator NlpD
VSFRSTLLIQQLVWPLLAAGAFVRGRRRARGRWDRATYGLTAVGYMALGATAGRWDVLATWLRPVLMAVTVVGAVAFVAFPRNPAAAVPGQSRAKRWGRALLGASMVLLVLVTRLSGAAEAPVALEFPLSNGAFYIVQGGASYLLNYHRVSAAQKFALDITRLGPGARRAAGLLPSDPSGYFVYGNDVSAPCTGRVRYAFDGLADSAIPSGDVLDPAGNHVAIDCAAQAVTVVLAHLGKGTVRVHTGDRVATGQVLASVGQSGHSSEPHLHIHAARETDDTGMRGLGVPMTFGGRLLVKNDVVAAGSHGAGGGR